MNSIHSVSVYCASSSVIDEVYVKETEKLGRLLGEKKLQVVNGAGSIGLMRVVSDAVLSSGGTVVGVIPRFMVENGWGYDALTRTDVVETMHERKQRIADISDAAIALPGGCGTFEELLEIITWKQLGLYLKPIVIFNINHYYDPLLEMFSRAIEQHFMRPRHEEMWQVAATAEEAVEMIFTQPTWPKDYAKFAKL